MIAVICLFKRKQAVWSNDVVVHIAARGSRKFSFSVISPSLLFSSLTDLLVAAGKVHSEMEEGTRGERKITDKRLEICSAAIA